MRCCWEAFGLTSLWQPGYEYWQHWTFTHSQVVPFSLAQKPVNSTSRDSPHLWAALIRGKPSEVLSFMVGKYITKYPGPISLPPVVMIMTEYWIPLYLHIFATWYHILMYWKIHYALKKIFDIMTVTWIYFLWKEWFLVASNMLFAPKLILKKMNNLLQNDHKKIYFVTISLIHITRYQLLSQKIFLLKEIISCH